MINKHIIARTGAALFAAALVAGATTASAAVSDPAKAPKSSELVSARASAATKYCVVSKTTGSRLSRKECRTRDEWIAREDFDPLAPNR